MWRDRITARPVGGDRRVEHRRATAVEPGVVGVQLLADEVIRVVGGQVAVDVADRCSSAYTDETRRTFARRAAEQSLRARPKVVRRTLKAEQLLEASDELLVNGNRKLVGDRPEPGTGTVDRGRRERVEELRCQRGQRGLPRTLVICDSRGEVTRPG